MQLSWFGHGTWLISTNDTRVLTDPCFDPEFTTTKPNEIDPPDYVLITHAHETRIRHLDAFCETSTIVANTELTNYLYATHDITEAHPLNLGGILNTKDGTEIMMVCAEHAHGLRKTSYIDPSQTPESNQTNVGTAAGFVVSDAPFGVPPAPDATTLYYTGETQIMSEMKDYIGPHLQPDALATPIGEEHTGRFSMGPSQTAIACDWLGVDTVFPMLPPSATRPLRDLDEALHTVDAAAESMALEPGHQIEL